jgi:hypothetical protein
MKVFSNTRGYSSLGVAVTCSIVEVTVCDEYTVQLSHSEWDELVAAVEWALGETQ